MVDGVEEIFGFASKSSKKNVVKVKKRAPEEPSMQDRIKAMRKRYNDQGQNRGGKLKYRKPVNANEGIMTGSVATQRVNPKSNDRVIDRSSNVTRSKQQVQNPNSGKRNLSNKNREIRSQSQANPTSPNMLKR